MGDTLSFFVQTDAIGARLFHNPQVETVTLSILRSVDADSAIWTVLANDSLNVAVVLPAHAPVLETAVNPLVIVRTHLVDHGRSGMEFDLIPERLEVLDFQRSENVPGLLMIRGGSLDNIVFEQVFDRFLNRQTFLALRSANAGTHLSD